MELKKLKKFKQDKVLTAIVGSYPKPKYIFSKSGRKLLDSLGMTFYELEKQIGKEKFQNRLEKASILAIRDQNAAGVDWVTDGEEKRDHYVLYVLRKLGGINFKKLKKVNYRGGILQRDVPIVDRKIRYKGQIVVKDFLYTKKYARKIPKIGLPGPSTVVDCVADEFYKGNLEQMAFDYAKAIRSEVKALISAGCQVIQFDDPVLLRFPERAKKWGLKALMACFEGLEVKATYVVHICRGYPNKPLEKKGIVYKANSEYYKNILSWISKSTIDVVSIEGQQGNLDLSVLPAIGRKTVMLGVLDVGINKVESVSSLYKRGAQALQYVPKNQLILAPDCGMLELSQVAAKRKLVNMSKAATKLNRNI